jgi:hypothetical protein
MTIFKDQPFGKMIALAKYEVEFQKIINVNLNVIDAK